MKDEIRHQFSKGFLTLNSDQRFEEWWKLYGQFCKSCCKGAIKVGFDMAERSGSAIAIQEPKSIIESLVSHQTHFLNEAPCPFERGKKWLKPFEREEDEGI